MDELQRLSSEEYQSVERLPLVVVLDNIRSQHNVGSVFRTSDAFRVEKIILCGITATPPNREIQKSALGATETVRWTYYENTIDAVNDLRQEGYEIIGVEQVHESINLLYNSVFTPEKKTVIVLGNEVFGISDDVLALCDRFAEIPQFGTKHSLNISVCAGILLWEYVRECNIFKDKS